MKTIKDIKVIEEDINGCMTKYDITESHTSALIAIKEAVIKDIKQIKILDKTPQDKQWEELTGKKIVYSEEAKQGIINYIKWKFNITEEELIN